MSDLFADLPWFLKEYVHSNRWSSFRSIQTETYELIRNSDCHILIAAGTSSGKTEAALFPVISSLYTKPPLLSSRATPNPVIRVIFNK